MSDGVFLITAFVCTAVCSATMALTKHSGDQIDPLQWLSFIGCAVLTIFAGWQYWF